MNEQATKPVAAHLDASGVPTADILITPKEETTRVRCRVPPDTVVPVVFIPGIMGSNLRNKKTKEPVWTVNSTLGVLFQWAFRSSATRQTKLNPETAELDPEGVFPGKSATVPNVDVARERGWGGPAKMSYGKFLRWLDDNLNQHLSGDTAHATHDCEDGSVAAFSPWAQQFGKSEIAEHWGCEKPFEPLTKDEAEYATNLFMCPVHAVGYNWLQSNRQSGIDLAAAIDTIIAYWNNKTVSGHKPYRCEKVILVTHSMGGLVARAAVHPEMGNAADKVLGIVHGVQPAVGAAAAYHHCRSGYDGMVKIVLGRNAAQVTAIFANSPGAMELLPSQDYPKNWLKVTDATSTPDAPLFSLPKEDPYDEIYLEKNAWWRLVDPKLIDPAGIHEENEKDPWEKVYFENVKYVKKFHENLSKYYHDPSYIHYGATASKHHAYGDLVWLATDNATVATDVLKAAPPQYGSDPVHVKVAGTTFSIAAPDSLRNRAGFPIHQPGDGTVPASSGQAPWLSGSDSIKQSFRMGDDMPAPASEPDKKLAKQIGFEHQDSYNDEQVRQNTLYCIGKILQLAKDL